MWEPGALETLSKVGKVHCSTPWPVEFARSSRSRHWAPTLVKVEQGNQVRAAVLFYSDDPELVKNALACREGIDLQNHPKSIQECEVKGIKARPIWYTALNPNINDLRADCLARLAIASVRPCPERNGIRYLRGCMENEVRTALTDAYCCEILRISGCASLEEAENWAAQ